MATKLWECRYCSTRFEVHTKPRKSRPYCPGCGDIYDVRAVKKPREAKKKAWRSGEYTAEEEKIVFRILEGTLVPSQAAPMLGRSVAAVSSKATRMRKELNWKGYEIKGLEDIERIKRS